YFAAGANQTITGIYTDVLITVDGCDSTILTNLTVNPIYTTNVDVEICDGESYFAAGANQTVTGIYTDIFTSIDGCDSTILTNLTVNPIYTTNVDVAICDGESYFAQGANQTVTGIYTDILTTIDGCDSTILTNLTVNPVYTTNVDVEICDGESYFAAGVNQTITGIYTDVLISIDGCDSTILTNLTVNPIYTTNVDVEICDGESYFAAGANQTVTGIYTDVLTSIDGCDSTILTNLTVNPVYTTNVDVAICDGESYFAQGANQTITGIYTDVLTTIDGCDSTILTNLTVNPVYTTNVDVAICDGESYFAAGANQTETGIYTDVLTTIYGCDSTILTNLTVNPIYTTNVDVEICDGESYFAAGANQTVSGIYTDVLTTVDGCDSTILTNLTVNPVYTTNVDVAICDGESYFAAGADQFVSGIYTDVLTSVDGCDSTIITNLTVYQSVNTSISTINVSCFGLGNGSIDLEILSGVAPITYLWSDGSTSQDINNLIAGIYTISITDGNSCTYESQIAVIEPANLSVSLTTINVNCFGASAGSVSTSVTGGTLPYAYLWSNGDTTSSISNLYADLYFVTIIDANNCYISDSAEVTQSDIIQVSSVVPNSNGYNISCNGGSNGSIDITVTGGNTPYYYFWTNGETTEDIGNLSADNYFVFITDINNCNLMQSFVITEPDSFSMNSMVENVLCAGDASGSVDISVSGGVQPYSYLWSNAETTEDISNLIFGSYSVSITDLNLCDVAYNFNINEPTSLMMISESITDVPCFGDNGGEISISISGGTSPYSFAWSDGTNMQNITSLFAGAYTLTVTDDNACSQILNYSVNEPTSGIMISSVVNPISMNISADGAIDITVSGGTPSYNYLWSGGETTEDISNLVEGTYIFEVTDSQNCVATDTFILVPTISITSQAFTMVPGWNWISFNVLPLNDSINNVLQNYLANDNDQIVSQSNGIAQYGFGQWWSPEFVIEPGKMYKIYNSSSNMISFNVVGYPVDITQQITIYQGWTWIGYNPQTVLDISTALASLNTQNNDQLVSQTDGFATFGYGQWWGLTAGMIPGQGYKLYSSISDVLEYPSGTSNLAKSDINNELYSIENWTPEKGKKNTVPIVAQVRFSGGDFIIAEGSKMAVFKDNVCRGVTDIIECTSGYIFQLPIMSDDTEEMGFAFKIFDAATGDIYTATESLRFEVDSKLGTIQNPILFTIQASNLNQVPNMATSLGENTPNPFSETTIIPFVIAESGKVSIEIFDNSGKKVLLLTNEFYQKGKHQIVWDRRNEFGKYISNGVYFYRMKTQNFVSSKKLILIE
ncbi:MAG: T9SS type A sorting domain-containing protein, partial [Bacteroidetes bacterium]|nr:T9SS type A sorting domain-containing protein [Bacteroidota bacterium]